MPKWLSYVLCAALVASVPVVGPSAASAVSDPTSGKTLVFHDGFTGSTLDTSKWVLNSSWSYPNAGPTNHPNHKLDHFNDSSLTVSGGVASFTATKRSDGDWNTALITTGNARSTPSGGSFKLKTGDLMLSHVQLPQATNKGAWPATWTWNDGGNEIDNFEWHSDNPNLLELTNHIRGGGKYYTDASLVKPGAWIWIGVEYGASSNTWYLGHANDFSDLKPIFSDGTGVGANWGGAYPIVNLSINDGTWHSAPINNTPIVFKIGSFRVYRPGGSTPTPTPTQTPPASPSPTPTPSSTPTCCCNQK